MTQNFPGKFHGELHAEKEGETSPGTLLTWGPSLTLLHLQNKDLVLQFLPSLKLPSLRRNSSAGLTNEEANKACHQLHRMSAPGMNFPTISHHTSLQTGPSPSNREGQHRVICCHQRDAGTDANILTSASLTMDQRTTRSAFSKPLCPTCP